MADLSNNGNGTKLKVEIQERAIETLIDGQKEILDLLKTYFGADGICPRERAANAVALASLKTHTKWQWGAITGIVGGFSAWLGYVTRLVIEHFQRTGG